MNHGFFFLHFIHNFSRIKRWYLHHQCFFIVTGKEKQALDKILHSFCFLRNRRDSFIQHFRIVFSPSFKHVRISSDDGYWRPEFMTRIGDELFLTVITALDTVKHPVDHRRKIFQFVLCSGNIDPVWQIAFRQRFCHGSDITDGCKHAFVQPLIVPEKIDHQPENPQIMNIQIYKPFSAIFCAVIKLDFFPAEQIPEKNR